MKMALLSLLALTAATVVWAAPAAVTSAPAAPAATHPAKVTDLSPLVTVRVLPRADVPGDEFTLAEVAEVDGADTDTVRRVAGISLGRSPQPGRSMRLTEGFLRSRLNVVIADDQVKVTVPPDAEVTRASQVISGDDIGAKVLALAAQQAGVPEGDLEQKLLSPIQDAVLPTGDVTWQIEPLGHYLAAGGSRTYRVVAQIQGNEVWRAIARINQQVFRKVVVALRSVRRDRIIRTQDVALQRKPVSGKQDDSYLTHLSEAVGSKSKRDISRGEWLNQDMLTPVADVAEGGPVMLVYQTEHVRFTSPGVALVPAKVGQFIPVRNLESGKIVYGVVASDDIVKVN
ncbi:MAG TPA: flagellar basal body P-ring formation chaperone FlgA [bacterium]|nr:flagellar basal body P-ring formation chaperone FlgA [bacterium]